MGFIASVLSFFRQKPDLHKLLNKQTTVKQVQEAIAQGANLHAKNIMGKTPLEWAVFLNLEPKIIETLVESGADVKTDGYSLIFATLLECHRTPEVLETLVKVGTDINARNKDGMTALMWATIHKFPLETIAALIKAGADVNACNKDGIPGLMWVAACGCTPEVIQLFVKAGSDVNFRNENGMTTLIVVAKFTQNPEIVTTLVNLGADLDIQDKNGLTALMWAIEKNENLDVITALVTAGADVNVCNKIGVPALFSVAVLNKNPEIIKMLVRAGADVNSRDKNGMTALMCATGRSQNTEMFKVLVAFGSDVNAQDKDGRTALMLVILLNHNPEIIIKILMDAGADTAIQDKDGKTALMWAVEKNQKHEVITALKTNNIDNFDAKTPKPLFTNSLEAIIIQAYHQGWLPDQKINIALDWENVFTKSSERLFKVIIDAEQEKQETLFYQIFCYLFAKGVEAAILKEFFPNEKVTFSYQPEQLNEDIQTIIPSYQHQMILKSLETAKVLFQAYQAFLLDCRSKKIPFDIFEEISLVIKSIPQLGVCFAYYKKNDFFYKQSDIDDCDGKYIKIAPLKELEKYLRCYCEKYDDVYEANGIDYQVFRSAAFDYLEAMSNRVRVNRTENVYQLIMRAFDIYHIKYGGYRILDHKFLYFVMSLVGEDSRFKFLPGFQLVLGGGYTQIQLVYDVENEIITKVSVNASQ